MLIRRLSGLFLAFMLLALVAPAHAQTPPADQAQADCKALSRTDFSKVQDAPTHVMTAQLVAATGTKPAYCQVNGYISPNILFEMRLPPTGWNGKFMKLGCGGFCGMLVTEGCNGPVARGYACIADNMGHVSTPLDAKWAYNNLQGEYDFGIRSTHVTALAGKAITAAYYHRGPDHSYHVGCSTGGREGMIAAQRFPTDFDGIVVGAPAIHETGSGYSLLWNAMAALRPDGSPLLTPDDVRLVHRAAVAACDGKDGLKDGIIDNPRQCRFDPRSLVCKGAGGGACLTADKAAAVAKIYGGAVDSKGRRLFAGTAMPGSELNWIGPYVSPDGGPSIYANFIGDMMRYMNFDPDPGPSWKMTDFDWDKDIARMDMREALYNAQNPDLRRFRDAGGRMIVFQGWADQSILPENIIDYVETATRTMGGHDATSAFMRLFMVPGMNHCTGGDGAWMIDYIDALEKWVEGGKAPEKLVGYHPREGSTPPAYYSKLPEKPDAAFSRAFYAWPAETRYDGKGDPNDAASFRPLPSSKR
ncbi:tannase/feruloyl esterase family alpha/beta hydrolase [Sphingobium aromaticivastans]|uniref:tannase/feruloyl esterase family alpha/beta hydrolase n=1 Tax=Sphingobium aromaticivastans TaxID=1778665 RepID=UPI0030179E01